MFLADFVLWAHFDFPSGRPGRQADADTLYLDQKKEISSGEILYLNWSRLCSRYLYSDLIYETSRGNDRYVRRTGADQ
jgi:hypothetical protein